MIKNYAELNQIVVDAPTFPIQDMLAKTMAEVSNHQKIMVSISGGSDSDILLDAIHRLDPDKKAKYVFFNTGLEYDATKRHLAELEEKYDIKIEWVPPVLPIPTCCRQYGVPFWSKQVSEFISRLQRHNFKWEDRPFEELVKEYPRCVSALKWWCDEKPRRRDGKPSSFSIKYVPWLKKFMVATPPDFPVSQMCCTKAKKEPAHKYEKAHNFDLHCTGIRKHEGGVRSIAYKSCISRNFGGDADTFRPLFWLTDKDKEDYKEHYGVVNSDCYEVWGMDRTGCCGCPFDKNFEKSLALIRQYEPKMYKAVNNIFGMSYEYTRKYLKFRERMKVEAAGLEYAEQISIDELEEW